MKDLAATFFVSLAFDFGRYALVACAVFATFWLWLGDRLHHRWLRPRAPETASMVREIRASVRTVLIFAVLGTVVVFGRRAGVFRIYLDPHRHGIPYLLATPLILIVLQDTYFYFMHRAMHHRWLYHAVHHEHHISRHTSPFTAYAFSPAEALAHGLFVPLVTLVLPAHVIAVFVFLAFMIVRNVLGHLAIELYPRGFVAHRLGAMHTTTTHHALHHLRPHTNFGLYFTWWDRALGTTDPTYERRFAEVTAPRGTAVEIATPASPVARLPLHRSALLATPSPSRLRCPAPAPTARP